MIYNLFFHPLRGYPGPLLCRATPLPRMRARLAGRSPLQSLELHKRYGKVVRVSPNELSYSDGDAWKGLAPQPHAYRFLHHRCQDCELTHNL